MPDDGKPALNGERPAAEPPPRAPWLQPGVVVHDPNFAIDDLLAGFARDIRSRGFKVRGFVQTNNPAIASAPGQGCADTIELVDLATDATIVMARQPRGDEPGALRARDILLQAMRDGADLVVIGRFSALTQGADGLGEAVRDGMSAGFPVLTSVAGKCVGKWTRLTGRDPTLVGPNIESLWRWWGPDRLYADLVQSVDDACARRIVVGPRWLFVEGDEGAGLANLPKGGEQILRRHDHYRRLGLRGMVELAYSWDPVERALAVAAINAATNRRGLAVKSGDGLDVLGKTDGRVVLVGAFPGYRDRMPHAQVVESNPRDGEFPMAAAECLLPGCVTAILSSACLINRSLPRMLSLAGQARVALAGLATPLTPRLQGYGIHTLSGFIVTNPNGLADAVARGAKPWAFAPFGRIVHCCLPTPGQASASRK